MVRTPPSLPLPNEPGSDVRKRELFRMIQNHLGAELRALYPDPTRATLPDPLSRMARRLQRAIGNLNDPADRAFVKGLLDFTKSLRAYAISLTKNIDQAEDLVQETIFRAIKKQRQYTPGTNLQAWLITILRNCFHTQYRKIRHEIEDSDGIHALELITIPDQMAKLELQDFEAAIGRLPKEQSQALLLVTVDGLSYEEASRVLGTRVGTIKSRVNRARNQLAQLLGIEGDDGPGGNRIIR